jgi:hypothetical protein
MLTHIHCFMQAFKSRIIFSDRKAVPGTLELSIQFDGTAVLWYLESPINSCTERGNKKEVDEGQRQRLGAHFWARGPPSF